MAKYFIFILFTVFLANAFAARSEVRVAEKSTVRVGDDVRLGVLLVGQIEDTELLNRVYDINVFEAFTSEEERTFSSEQLALTLRKKLSFQDLQLLSVKIPESFKIKAVRNFLYPNDMMRQISQAAKNICLGCNIEFQTLELPDIKTSQEVMRVHLETQSIRQSGSFLLPLLVETSNGKTNYWVTGKMNFFRLAPVATRMIKFGERIQPGDFEFRSVNVSFAKDGVPQESALSGKVAGKTLNVGQVIYLGDLKKEAAATRGQMVKIIVGGTDLEVISNGTAEETGSIGDLIRVKSSDTQKILSGVLVEKGTVRVE